jgi:hypothetical protein
MHKRFESNYSSCTSRSSENENICQSSGGVQWGLKTGWNSVYHQKQKWCFYELGFWCWMLTLNLTLVKFVLGKLKGYSWNTYHTHPKKRRSRKLIRDWQILTKMMILEKWEPLLPKYFKLRWDNVWLKMSKERHWIRLVYIWHKAIVVNM